MSGTLVGRRRRPRFDIPDPIAPELTIKNSCCDKFIWSTRARKRAVSMRPRGATRLVPTLTTMRITRPASQRPSRNFSYPQVYRKTSMGYGASRFRGGIPGAASADFADNDWLWLV